MRSPLDLCDGPCASWRLRNFKLRECKDSVTGTRNGFQQALYYLALGILYGALGRAKRVRTRDASNARGLVSKSNVRYVYQKLPWVLLGHTPHRNLCC